MEEERKKYCDTVILINEIESLFRLVCDLESYLHVTGKKIAEVTVSVRACSLTEAIISKMPLSVCM